MNWGFRPRIVTVAPMAERKCPYSAAMYPPPMMATLLGRRVRLSRVSLVRYPTSSRPDMDGIRGLDPVQSRISLDVIVSSPIARV